MPLLALKSASSAIGIGMPAAATCAGGPNSSFALPADARARHHRPRVNETFASISKRGLLSPPPAELDLHALVGRQFTRDAAGTARPPVLPSTRHGPISFWPSIKTFSA